MAGIGAKVIKATAPWAARKRLRAVRMRNLFMVVHSSKSTIAPLAASLGLLAVFSPIKLGQFQCPSPTQVFQFHCQLATALRLGDVHGFLLSNSHAATLSVPAPMNVTGITRLSISSRTMKQASVSSTDQGGGKRRVAKATSMRWVSTTD
jgi:hypothetical protein